VSVGGGVGEDVGVDSGEVGGVESGVSVGVGVAVGVSVGVGEGSGVAVGAVIGAVTEIGNVGVTISKRPIVAAMGEVRRAGQVVGSPLQPSFSHGSNARYTPRVVSPSPELVSTTMYNVARRISVPGGKTSRGK
jgi:hypothetical protein